MDNYPDYGLGIKDSFTSKMEGGAFVFTSDKEQRLLIVNDNLVSLFECDDADDLMEYTGGTFDGMIHDPDASLIRKEMEDQVKHSINGSGYVFYNIITKKKNVLRVVNHWTLVHDDIMGDVFYGTLYVHRLDNVVNDFDNVTGLIGNDKVVSA